MQFKLGARRTLTNPVEGVKFDRRDEDIIAIHAMTLATLPNEMIGVLRDGLARQILFLEELGDWIASGTEEETDRMGRLMNSMLLYQATYSAKVVRSLDNRGLLKKGEKIN